MNYRAHYGSSVLSFSLNRHEKATLRITVQPDLGIAVTAPEGAEIEAIKKRVAKRGLWIRRQQKQFELYLPKPTPRKFVTGESYRYLGRQYRLRVIQDSENTGVAIGRGQIEVRLGGKITPERTQVALESWFTERAKEKLLERFESFEPLCCRYGFAVSGLTIRKMSKRWGSCTSKGRVLLNPELVKVPVDCIDYVIIHELCHLKQHSHGAEFIRLLSRILPDWQRRKARLEKVEV